MKYVAAFMAAGIVIAVVGAFAVLGTRAEQATPLPPDRRIEEVIPEIVAAVARGGGPDAMAAMAAIGHLGDAQQPSPFSRPPETDDPVIQQRWEQSVEAGRKRRERIYGLLQSAVPNLVRLASGSDAATRRRAMWALGSIRAESADVIALLQTKAEDTTGPSLERQAAILALSKVNPAAARVVLAPWLTTRSLDPGLFSAATFALRTMGADALPLLRPLLSDPDILRRLYAVSVARSMGAAAAPAAADLAASLTPESPPRLQAATLRTLLTVAPHDVATLERVVATPAFSRSLCGTAGEALARRPGALAFDYTVCTGHAADPQPTPTTDTVQRALIAAAGGTGDLAVTRSVAAHLIGDNRYPAESPERIIVACVEPRGAFEAIRKRSRDGAAAIPANELRIAAVRVAGEDLVLDSVGGLIITDAPAAACDELSADWISEPGQWPLTQIQFTTLQASKGAVMVVRWAGQIDVSTRHWKVRTPSEVYYLRDDGSMFADQTFLDLTDTREVSVVGRWSGIEAPFSATPPPLDARYQSMSTSRLIGVPQVIVPMRTLSDARWTRVVMYPYNFSGAPGARPVIPEGTPVQSMMGGIILPYEPELPEQLVEFWRKYLTHDHLSVRLAAAQKLAELKDRRSLAAIVGILQTPTDLALEVMRSVKPFGTEAVPYLEPLLRSNRLRVRQSAWKALGQFGADAAPLIRKTLESGSDEERALALTTLKDLRPSPPASLMPLLVPLLERCDTPAVVMLSCFDLLDAIQAAGPGAAVARPALEQRLEKSSGWMRLRAASALLAVGARDRAMAAIVDMARTGGASDSESALRYLVPEIKGDALPIFIEVLQRPDGGVASSFAAQQIGALSPAPESAYPVVVRMIRHVDPAIRRRTIPALKGYRTPDATALLGALMKDPDIIVRREAFSLLKDRGVDAVPLIAHVLDDPGNPLRSDLIGHLYRLGPPVAAVSPAAVTSLERLSREDPDPGIRNYAAAALKAIRAVKP